MFSWSLQKMHERQRKSSNSTSIFGIFWQCPFTVPILLGRCTGAWQKKWINDFNWNERLGKCWQNGMRVDSRRKKLMQFNNTWLICTSWRDDLLICARIISIHFDFFSDFTFIQRFKKKPTVQHSNYYGLLLGKVFRAQKCVQSPA